MKYNVSSLMSFDSESMSDCTPHLTGIRVTERIPKYFKRWFQTQHFRQLKASVENEVLGHGSGNLWTLVEANPEPVGSDQLRYAPRATLRVTPLRSKK